jgi:hypothetical protein
VLIWQVWQGSVGVIEEIDFLGRAGRDNQQNTRLALPSRQTAW